MQEAPPGILDLTWKPSPSYSDGLHEDSSFDLQPHLWSRLPKDLLHSVLERLPFQSILCFRRVCMEWKALFGSPTFHHFASQRTHIPPWIFFLGSPTFHHFASHRTHIPPWIFFPGSSRRVQHAAASYIGEIDADTQYDDGHDDNGYVFEEDAHGDMHNEDDEHSDSHVNTSDGEHSDSHVNTSDDSYVNASDDTREMHDAVICGDHGRDMHDVTRCGDHGDTHRLDGRDDDTVNVNAHEKLLLFFDCEFESWHAPLAIPPGFNETLPQISLNRYDVCSFQEQVLILAGYLDPPRIFLFNLASPSCKELPPCICIKELEGLGLSEERSTLSSFGTSTSLGNLSLSNEKRITEGMMAKFLQVVAVGETSKKVGNGLGTYVVESFNSMTGSWHICGRFQQSDDTIFAQTQMVFCKGSFYAKVACGILKINNLLVGQNMERTFYDFPEPPNQDGAEDMELTESHLVATKFSVFLVGVTASDEDCDVIIWQFHAPGWQLLTYMPKSILDDFIGDVRRIDCLAHGELIFFQVPNRQRFLIYDVSQKLWRFSAKCKYFLGSMTFVWEPRLRN